jgi:hypothetical protein
LPYALPPYDEISSIKPRSTHNQPQLVRPIPGIYRKTYIKVVNGRKMMPRSGKMNVA